MSSYDNVSLQVQVIRFLGAVNDEVKPRGGVVADQVADTAVGLQGAGGWLGQSATPFLNHASTIAGNRGALCGGVAYD